MYKHDHLSGISDTVNVFGNKSRREDSNLSGDLRVTELWMNLQNTIFFLLNFT